MRLEKRKGRHIYLPMDDWRSRHEWLKNKAESRGFEVLTLHSASKATRIDDGVRSFTIDQTDFTGILKVTDETLFAQAMATGIGSTAKTFGFGMLVI